MFFDIGPLEMLALVILAVIVFGPDKLPKVVSDVMAFIRKVRDFSDHAKADIRKELGPEFQDFEFEDLNPRTFVRKNLLASDDLGLREIRNGFSLDDADEPRGRPAGGSVPLSKDGGRPSAGGALGPGERPPYDADAT